MQQQVSLAELFPVMLEVLENGGEVSFITAGTSMLPFIRDRKDKAVLVKPKGRLEKYDVPLYTRADGSFILHRIVGFDPDGCYIMCGDNQAQLEHGVSHAQVIGRLKGIYKDGKYISCDGNLHKLYCRTLVFRRFFKRLKWKIKRMIRGE